MVTGEYPHTSAKFHYEDLDLSLLQIGLYHMLVASQGRAVRSQLSTAARSD